MGKGDVSTLESKSLQRVMLHSVICHVYGVYVCVCMCAEYGVQAIYITMQACTAELCNHAHLCFVKTV